MPPSEQDIQRKILRYLNGLPECVAYKIAAGPYSMGGLPDVLCCYRGRMVAVEVKKTGGRTTAQQEARLAELRAAGGWAIVAFSVDDVAAIIAAVDLDIEHGSVAILN